MPTATKALITSVVYGPLFLLAVWSAEEGSGVRHLPFASKVGLTFAMVAWLGMLLVLRARHQAKVRAAMSSMEEAEATAARLATARVGCAGCRGAGRSCAVGRIAHAAGAGPGR